MKDDVATQILLTQITDMLNGVASSVASLKGDMGGVKEAIKNLNYAVERQASLIDRFNNHETRCKAKLNDSGTQKRIDSIEVTLGHLKKNTKQSGDIPLISTSNNRLSIPVSILKHVPWYIVFLVSGAAGTGYFLNMFGG